MVQIRDRPLERFQCVLEFRRTGERLYRVGGVGNGVDERLKIDLVEFLQRLCQAFLELRQIGRHGRYLRIRASRLQHEIRPRAGVKVKVDIQQPGEQALNVKLG